MAEGPCTPWPINTDCCADWATYTPAVQQRATEWASYILYALTGRRFDSCTVIERPCGPACLTSFGWMTWPVTMDGGNSAAAGWMIPFIDAGGTWRNCTCPGACTCRADCEIILSSPVQSITTVHVDGVLIPSSSYRLDPGGALVRTDGECWPDCQDFNVSELTDPDTFFVTYVAGEAVPMAGQSAAGILACDFAKTCTTGCKLPGNLSSLSRQGIDVQMIDPTQVLQDGLTGIAEVDLFIRAVNPYGVKGRTQLYSPDLVYARRSS